MSASTSEFISAKCPCGKHLRFPISAAGRKARCNACGQTLRIPSTAGRPKAGFVSKPPPLSPVPALPDATTDRTASSAGNRILVECSCGQKLRVSATKAGKKGQCPGCGGVLHVPLVRSEAGLPVREAPRRGPAASPPLRSVPADDEFPEMTPGDEPDEDEAEPGSLLGELAFEEERGAGQAAVVHAIPCPNCSIAMSASAAKCPACGHDRKKARSRRQSNDGGGGGAAAAAAVAGAFSGVVKLTGPLIKGCLFSVVGAVIGGIIWYAVAAATDYEFGWIAWGVGLLAGFGMHLGCGDGNMLTGALAAVIALGGILVGKLLVIVFIVFPILVGETDEIDRQREYVICSLVDERLAEEEADFGSDADYDAAWDLAEEDVRKDVNTWSDERVQEEWARQRELDAQRAAEYAEEEGELDEETPEIPASAIALFVARLFGFRGLIFIILAMVSAFKLGYDGPSIGS